MGVRIPLTEQSFRASTGSSCSGCAASKPRSRPPPTWPTSTRDSPVARPGSRSCRRARRLTTPNRHRPVPSARHPPRRPSSPGRLGRLAHQDRRVMVRRAGRHRPGRDRGRTESAEHGPARRASGQRSVVAGQRGALTCRRRCDRCSTQPRSTRRATSSPSTCPGAAPFRRCRLGGSHTGSWPPPRSPGSHGRTRKPTGGGCTRCSPRSAPTGRPRRRTSGGLPRPGDPSTLRRPTSDPARHPRVAPNVGRVYHGARGASRRSTTVRTSAGSARRCCPRSTRWTCRSPSVPC